MDEKTPTKLSNKPLVCIVSSDGKHWSILYNSVEGVSGQMIQGMNINTFVAEDRYLDNETPVVDMRSIDVLMPFTGIAECHGKGVPFKDWLDVVKKNGATVLSLRDFLIRNL